MGEVDPDGDVAGLYASVTGFAALTAFDAFTDLEAPTNFDAFTDLDHPVIDSDHQRDLKTLSTVCLYHRLVRVSVRFLPAD